MNLEELNIELDHIGNTAYRHEISVSFSIKDEIYWVTIIEEGLSDDTGNSEMSIEVGEDFPFELTDELQEEMLSVYELQAADKLH